ncbi:class I adenylate-forming enzyme family protein [Nannocystis sp. ILAH1]|uniref:AMP-binding protein n=1 Tax=Nannocystis sp. ILAH1 TaxID=2996789 RepID=UPI00226DD249|nr:class I adenylate-forming enzyme family protein [Nannocystis sp. ILAH1]
MSTLVHSLVALRGCPLPGLVIVGDDGAKRIRSFGELVVAVEGFAARLVSRGIRRGERVAIAAPDPEYMVVASLGALRAGVVPVVLPDPSGRSAEVWRVEVTEVMRASEAQRVIRPSSRGSLPPLGEVREQLIDDLGEHPLGPVFLANAALFKGDDVALLVCTTDRTGTGQVTSYTHAALVAAADAALAQTRSPEAGDKVLACAGLDRCLIAAVLAPLRRRVPFVIPKPPVRDAVRWRQLIDELGVTVAIADSALAMIEEQTEPSRVRVLGTGGEKVQAAAAESAVADQAQEKLMGRHEQIVASTASSEGATALGGPGGRSEQDMSVATSEATPALAGPRGQDANSGASASEGAGQLRVTKAPILAQITVREGATVLGGSSGRDVLSLVAAALRPQDVAGESLERAPRIGGSSGRKDMSYPTFASAVEVGDAAPRAEVALAANDDAIVVQGCSYDPQPIEREAARVPGICAGQVIALTRPGKLSDELVVVAEGRPVDRVVLNTMAATLRRRIQAALGLQVAALVQVPVGALPRTVGGELQRAAARALYASQPGA